MRILITNITLASRTGTETYTKGLAIKLLRLGHLPIVYSPMLGPISDEIRAAGVPVTDRISAIGDTPDVIHGHHTPTTITAVARFPDTPAIFISHDFTAWHDAPPLLPSIRRYVAIVQSTADRLVFEGGISPEQTMIMLNAVDIDRFTSPDPPAHQPRKAAVFAKGEHYLPAIQEACAARQIDVEFFGSSVDKLIESPETVLPHYDIIFASGLGAMEAIACNRAAIVCDLRGLAGLCTSERYPKLREMNFGLRALTKPFTSQAIIDEIDLYDAADIAKCSELFRVDGNLDTYVDRLVSLYREVIAENERQPIKSSVHAAALSNCFEQWAPSLGDPRWPWTIEREDLLSQIESLRTTNDDDATRRNRSVWSRFIARLMLTYDRRSVAKGAS